jgi:hypothetical protein
MLTLQEYIEEMGCRLDHTDMEQIGSNISAPIEKAYCSKQWSDCHVVQAGDTLLIDTSTQTMVETVDLLLDLDWMEDLAPMSLEDMETHVEHVASIPARWDKPIDVDLSE